MHNNLFGKTAYVGTNFDSQDKTAGENNEKREGLKVVDTYTTFDRDKKPIHRLIDKYDDKGRLRSRRREYLDQNGDVVGGTDTVYTYDAEGRATEEQTTLPQNRL